MNSDRMTLVMPAKSEMATHYVDLYKARCVITILSTRSTTKLIVFLIVRINHKNIQPYS